MNTISYELQFTDEELEEFKRLEQLFDETEELRNFRLHEIGNIVLETTNDEYKTRRFLAFFVLNGLQNGSFISAMMEREK